MYRIGPQLVQSVGVGVLTEQQHSVGRKLPYKRCGLCWLQLKPYTQSTVTHLGSTFWVQWTVAFDAQRNLWTSLCSRSSRVPGSPAHLLVPDLTGRSGVIDLVLDNPSRVAWSWRIHRFPVQKGFKLEIGVAVVGAGVHMSFSSLATANREQKVVNEAATGMDW